MLLANRKYLRPEAEVMEITMEENILSLGQNEKPEIDPDFPGGDE